ncbi:MULTISPECIES: hypothetical protein [Streptomyces]|uniref:hypothetical protein n=1 Tax=Streptomyces TaxID=1883 RepID=UPI00131E8ED5|nr:MULTISPECIES: hypothetical protein [Streptomyces]MDI5905364.1 hypothetical protein [Streptomyces sp. 12257]
MDRTAVRRHAPAGASAPALTLRPWRSADAPEPAVLHRDEALGRWIGSVVDDEAGAAAGAGGGPVRLRRRRGTTRAIHGQPARLGAGLARGKGVAPRAVD